METSYIAFISYRHQPLDQAVAKKLHRLIEHFHVPKELRRDGSKRLGRVFRDEDELPLSTDLGESIHYALGHSEYLIAICTPEYQKSRWCMEELNSFIASHGRDHVLAVLAAGAPEESFPPQLLTDTDADGNIRAVEPLAANIAAPTNAKRMKRLKTEHLRLAAAMLGCSYDSLYQRERRYRQRRIVAASAAALAVAGVFIGTLINKNAQIQARYEEAQTNYRMAQTNLELAQTNLRLAQYNESVSLTENARNDLALGRRSDAVRTLLKAIPDSGNQPYDRTADGELISALGVYEDEGFRFISNIRQSTDIRSWSLSGDGKLLFTADEINTVRAWSVETGSLLWQTAIPFKTYSAVSIIWCGYPRSVICAGTEGDVIMLSAEDGRELWLHEKSVNFSITSILLRQKKSEVVRLTIQDEGRLLIRCIDLKAGTMVRECEAPVSPAVYVNLKNACLSPNGRYAATLARSSVKGMDVRTGIVADLETGDVHEYRLTPGETSSENADLAFLSDGTLLFSSAQAKGAVMTLTLEKIQPASGDVIYSTSTRTGLPDTINPVHLLACSSEYAMVVYDRMVYEFTVSDGKLLQQATMPGSIISIVKPGSYGSNVFFCSFSNGLVTYLVHVRLASDLNMYSLECGFPISGSRMEPNTDTAALVPRDRSNEVLLVKRINPSVKDLKSDTLIEDALLSPSGEKLLMFNFDHSSMAILDPVDDRIQKDLRLSGPSLPLNETIVFSADENTLYCGKYTVRASDGTVSELTIPGHCIERADTAFVSNPGKAVTAVLAFDTEYRGVQADANASAEEKLRILLENTDSSKYIDIPFFHIFVEGEDRGRVSLPEDVILSAGKYSGIFRLDGCGLLLASGDPDSTLLAYDVATETWRIWNMEETVVQAVSGNRDKIAVLLSGDSLRLADFGSGSILWKTAAGITSNQITGLWFSPDDSLLLITYGGTRASIYRVSDGTLLNDVQLDTDTNPCALSMQQDDSGLLYVYNEYYDQTVFRSGTDSLILDSATGELLGRIPGLMFVNFRTGKVYRFGRYSKHALIYPLYTREKLLELAEPFR